MARVVLADENSLVLDLMRIFLSDEGHDLELVSSAKGLLEQDLASLPRSSVLVLSNELDPATTSDLIQEVRTRADLPGLPCLLTMGPGGRDGQHLSATLANVQMIRKPFDRGTFLHNVRALVDLYSDQRASAENISEQVAAPAAEASAPETQPIQEEQSTAGLDMVQEGAEAISLAITREFERWFKERGAALVEMQIRSTMERGGNGLIQKIAWQIVPELAETMIRDEIKRITRDLDDETP